MGRKAEWKSNVWIESTKHGNASRPIFQSIDSPSHSLYSSMALKYSGSKAEIESCFEGSWVFGQNTWSAKLQNKISYLQTIERRYCSSHVFRSFQISGLKSFPRKIPLQPTAGVLDVVNNVPWLKSKQIPEAITDIYFIILYYICFCVQSVMSHFSQEIWEKK